MKVKIVIDDKMDENLIKIYTKTYNKDIENLQNFLENSNKNIIVGFQDEQVYILNYNDIVRFYTEDKKIYIETKTDTFISRLRLYEIEERVYDKNFIKISRYEIININYVKKIDLSFKGTIAVKMDNNKVSYVSRRSLKDFKYILGL